MRRRRIAVILLQLAVMCLLNARAGASEDTSVNLSEGAIIRGPEHTKRIALLFTGHEFAEGGETIANELARHGAKASFFFTGDFLRNPERNALIQRLLKVGHYVGPHSDKHLLYCPWDQPKRTLVSREQFRADLEANLQAIESFGVQRSQVRFFLPPFEHYNRQIANWSKEMGLTLVNFTPGTRANADYTGEGDQNYVTSQVILDSIVEKERQDPQGLNGFLLLLHIGSGPGRRDKLHALFGQLLDYLANKGYQFVRVDELLEGNNEIFIRASQLGYLADEPKIAIAFSKTRLPESFAVISAEAGNPQSGIYDGKLHPVTNSSWGQFQNHAEVDFSKVRVPGNYLLKIGESKSLPFSIGRDTFAGLPDRLLGFMRQQRCGYNPWLDAVCHPFDGRTAYGPLTNGSYVDACGGWHDAADLLKYLLTSGNATAQMLLAWELGGGHADRWAPGEGTLHSVFSDCFDDRGRGGTNGIADLLDEARWGVEWMLKLHPAPDQLYHQVADDRDHASRRLPQDENVDYGWGKGSYRVVYCADGQPQGLQSYKSRSTGIANLAGRYAAAMALAYQIWKDNPHERPFAERCLQAGKEVYELGRAKEGVQQGNSYKAPYRYEETTWADDMEWGAAELFRATHENRYLDEAKGYAKLAGSESWMGKEQTGHYQYYPFINLGHFRLYDLAKPDLKKELAGFYREGINACMKMGQANPYRVGVPFIWCSDNLVVALVTQCLLYERMTGDTTYREFAVKQRDWLLGRNPWGYSMFTWIGSVYPKDPHLMTMQLTGRPVPGGLVDGPVYERIFKALKGVSISEPDPLAEFQGAAVYHDDQQDYSSNEPTMDGTAAAILMFALSHR